jgi:hypothetical protein
LLAVACAVYLLTTVVLVHAWTDERGAYLLPLLPPALLITLHLTPRRWWYVAVAATALCGTFLRGDPDHGPPDLTFGRAVATMAERQPTVFFVADWHEMDSAFLVDPRLDLKVGNKEYDDLATAQRQQGFDVTPAMVAGWLTMIAGETRQKGARLVITDRAVQWMTAHVPAFGEGWSIFAETAGATRLGADRGVTGWVVE